MAGYKKVDGIPTIAMPRVPQAAVVRGSVATGKTQALANKVRALLAGGAEPASILVLCATRDAARAFEARLAAPGVRVTTAFDLALELLGTPKARAMFGHGPRVLLPYEEDVLFEDLKVSGLAVDRLEGMLSFFKRSMTEISDDHPDFLMDDDEAVLMETLRRNLELRGAYLECQVPANAARFLSSDAGQDVRWEHVLVDDYQLLSRASQVAAGLLATRTMCVAANPHDSDRVAEPHPYARGLDEFVAANPHAEVEELGAFCGAGAVRGAVNALQAEAGLDALAALEGAPAGSVSIDVLRGPNEEVEHAAGLIADALARGLAPGDIYVVGPNGEWGSRLADALDARGVRSLRERDLTQLALSSADASPDARYLRCLTALLLLGDPTDDCAWRDWCAFGDPLGASGAFGAIAELCASRGMRLHEALAWLVGEGSADARTLGASDAQRVLDAYAYGAGLVARLSGLGRDALLRALADEVCGRGEPVPEQLARLCVGAPAEADAAGLREHVLLQARSHGWEAGCAAQVEAACDDGAVRIGSMKRLRGLAPRMVVFIGFINGFYPPRSFFDETLTPPGKVAAARMQYARRLAVAAGKARDSLVFTAFTSMPCADAERLCAKIDRIGLEKRVRMARVSPSVFCEAIEAALRQ